MSELLRLMAPELILAAAACVLMLVGVSRKVSMRRLAAGGALVALIVVFAMLVLRESDGGAHVDADSSGAIRIHEFGYFIKMLAAGVGVLLVLVAWPSNG